MATTRPFAFNTGSTIPGTIQLGDLSIGAPTSGFTDNPQYWNGPNEDLGYVIGYTVTAGDQPNPVGIPAYVQFWRSVDKTNSSFLNLANFIGRKNGQPPFADTTAASTWLNSNGFYSDFVESGTTPTPTPTLTNTPTTSVTTTPTPSVTQTNTPSSGPEEVLVNPIITENDEYIEVGNEEYLMFVDPSSPSVTPTTTPTNTETPTPTPTNTETPTNTPTVTPSNTETPTPTPSFTPTPTTTDLTSVTTYTISGCTNLNVLVADLGPGALAAGDVFYLEFTGGTPSGCYRIVNKIDNTPSDGTTPLYFYTSCALCVAAREVTPTPTVTQTPTTTPTNTPTPSPTSIPVTGYGYNLVVLPYNPPSSGNTIFPTFATPGLNSGTTNPNTFATNAVYWNAIDNLGVDRSVYFNGMTGVSVTAYFTQSGNTAIYSGSSTAFVYDGSPGSQAFNYNPNVRAGQLVLIQSASTNFVTGQTVYISYITN